MEDFHRALHVLKEKGVIELFHKRDGSADASFEHGANAPVLGRTVGEDGSQSEDRNNAMFGALIAESAARGYVPAQLLAIGLAERVSNILETEGADT